MIPSFVIYNRLYGHVTEFSVIPEKHECENVRYLPAESVIVNTATEILKKRGLSSVEVGPYRVDIVFGSRRDYAFSVEV